LNFKLIATDLDGTFMRDFLTPHPDNVKIVEKCKKAGIAFCACTGRNWYNTRHIVSEVAFDRFFVINNGAAIFDRDAEELRYRNRIAPEEAHEILQILAGYENAHIDVSTTYGTHVLDRMDENTRRVWQERAKSNPVWAGGTYLHKTVHELFEASRDDIQRFGFGIDILLPGVLVELHSKLSRVADVEITCGIPGHTEITAKGGTKAEALSVLADIYGAEPENILAIGDNYNDMHMLLWAGTGVAMGNADNRLKDVADYVTDTNDNAGVAKAVERIVFGAGF